MSVKRPTGKRLRSRRIRAEWVVVCALLIVQNMASAAGTEVRIKDITEVEGDRINQLTGMGLVTGLNGTGGRSPVTRQFALNLLQRFGQRFDPLLRTNLRNDAKDRTDNLSVVTVTADLPPGRLPGDTIDVIVSSFDDAESLLGGTLIMTPLFGVDGEVYALAAGPLSSGGFSFDGQAASVQKNHPTAARIPNGATIELETRSTLGAGGHVRLMLKYPDYETARRIAEAINAEYPASALQWGDTGVDIRVPQEYLGDIAGFVGLVGELLVVPDARAVVVINERTGTVVIGENVKLSRVLITHANLAIMTSETPEVSQPLPFSDGETQVVPRTQVDVIEEEGLPVTMIDEQATVGDLAQALNALGVTPRDLSAIFQMLKESGALHADLEIK
jgi:flagellar P-ring protein precursor FlgI